MTNSSTIQKITRERERRKFSEEMKILQIMKYLASSHGPEDSAGFTAHHLARTAFSTRSSHGVFFGEQRDEDIKRILKNLVDRGYVEVKAGKNDRYVITEDGKVFHDRVGKIFFKFSMETVYGKKI
jgi:hypothetical protein